MKRNLKYRGTVFLVISLTLLSFLVRNKTYSFYSDKLQITLPEELKEIIGSPNADYLFFNKDSTFEFNATRIPSELKLSKNLEWCKNFIQFSYLNRATKVYSNDIQVINGTKIHVAEFEGEFSGKESYYVSAIVSFDEIIVGLALIVPLTHKEKYESEAKKILASVKVNTSE